MATLCAIAVVWGVCGVRCVWAGPQPIHRATLLLCGTLLGSAMLGGALLGSETFAVLY